MGKNIEHIQHVKSNVVLEGKPKLPQSGVLVEGELAVNYSDGYETISLENTNNEIVTFSSDEYYTEQKLGSAFTGANSAVTVTDVIEENEEIISAALNDLERRKLDASAYTPTDLSNYYTKDETSGKTEISTALSGKQNTLTTGTGINITNDVISVNADQIIDSTTSASTNPVSSKAVYDAVTDNELVWTNAYVTLSGAVSSHTSNNDIHVTAADKEKINSISTLSGTVTAHTANTNIHLTTTEKGQLHTHTNKTYLDGITGNVGTMAYENKASYSSATEVNTALSNKADKSTTLSGYGITNAYTKTEIDNMMGNIETLLAAI